MYSMAQLFKEQITLSDGQIDIYRIRVNKTYDALSNGLRYPPYEPLGPGNFEN